MYPNIKNEIITAKGLSIGYGKTKHRNAACLYQNLSFKLYEGELVCLLGSNGSGKSTLLRTISTSQSALGGNIFINNKNISKYKEKELSQILGLVLTDKTSAGGLTVQELVELGRYPYTGFFGQLSENDKNIAWKAMKDVGISHKSGSYIAELSDGERQKVMIAKSLAQECPIILLDEPTAFLDVESRIEIMNLLHSLALNHNKTILLSTHDIDIAFLLADKLWLLSKETGLECGVTEDIVLSGAMDHFFKSDNIIFNKESGHFVPNEKSDKNVFIKSDGYLYHWTKNILMRYGFQVVENKFDTLFTVNTVNPTNIKVIISDYNFYNFSSFAELANWLYLKSKE